MFNLLEGFTLCFFCNLAPIGPYKWLNNIFKNVSLSILHPSEVKDHFFSLGIWTTKVVIFMDFGLNPVPVGGGWGGWIQTLNVHTFL